jgi:uncharacterized protein YaeQ
VAAPTKYLTLRVTRHASETDAHMMTSVLAYCLEYVKGIAFSDGISSTEEPAVFVRDLTGKKTTGIEVGAPTRPGCTTGASWPTAPRSTRSAIR